MKLTFKDNNLYYYHYKIFNGELSFKLFILLIIILYFNKSFIKYVSYGALAIPIIGNYDAYLKYKQYNLIGIFIASALGHMVFLYPLINIKKYFEPNLIQFLLILTGLFIIYYLPYWPYNVPRTIMSYILIGVYILATLIYCFYFNYKSFNYY